ncbi:hypothetical protein HG421_01370 [Xanthomonas campestris pv. badrii]|uniref:Uncharacterized protein n=1 Tax=Xanthomonas campestris pv. badrii TaxID=149696 RepID=A0A7Z2V7E8_XANCA|nr:hypothetical protein [Xanthomonas campestris]QJD66258.1 hypothetical protein HG421_01370 [Xanthomonas campestris pv. badrii]
MQRPAGHAQVAGATRALVVAAATPMAAAGAHGRFFKETLINTTGRHEKPSRDAYFVFRPSIFAVFGAFVAGFLKRRRVTIRAFGAPNTPVSVDPAAKPGKEKQRAQPAALLHAQHRVKKISTGCTTFWDAGKGLFPRLDAASRASTHPHQSAIGQKKFKNPKQF